MQFMTFSNQLYHPALSRVHCRTMKHFLEKSLILAMKTQAASIFSFFSFYSMQCAESRQQFSTPQTLSWRSKCCHHSFGSRSRRKEWVLCMFRSFHPILVSWSQHYLFIPSPYSSPCCTKCSTQWFIQGTISGKTWKKRNRNRCIVSSPHVVILLGMSDGRNALNCEYWLFLSDFSITLWPSQRLRNEGGMLVVHLTAPRKC